MKSPTPISSTNRLDRLETYLRDDPQNITLLADAFDTALQAGAIERAEFHLRHGLALRQELAAWSLREVHWLLAQRRFNEARTLLLRLQAVADAPQALRAAVAHDLAYIDLREARLDAGLATLHPWRTADADGTPMPLPLQALWLRLMHRAGRLDEACAWARAQVERGTIGAEAAGVASLAALDAGDHAASERWADLALRQGGICTEALVARASTALARRDSRLARELLTQALALQPADGRTWSALGFCELLEHRLDAARTAFEKAVAAMPDHIGTWHGLGWAGLAAGDMAGAQCAFETALGLDRNFGESHGALAAVHALAGDRVAAAAGIERALRLDATSLAARYAQAVLDGQARDPQALPRLARRFLGSRAAPFGGTMADSIGLPADE